MLIPSMSGIAWVMSAAWPPVKMKRSGSPKASVGACILHPKPPRERPSASLDAVLLAALAAQALARIIELSMQTC